ncbi:pachytene checkpoint 2 [Carabus blaptoides fortunei]
MKRITAEIVKRQRSTCDNDTLIAKCLQFLQAKEGGLGTMITDLDDDDDLHEHVECIILEEPCDSKSEFDNLEFTWYVYSLNKFGGQAEHLDEGSDENSITLFTSWPLPALEFHGLWENLIYDTTIKKDLLQYVSTMMIFSEKGVDPNVVCSNRVVLLHGPPGTGKTSLSRALAQKLSIRLQRRYRNAQLVEINSHSLFSKWFSESGKLVSRLFARIHEMVEDPTMLVCVLIDEIESLAHARAQCMSGNEPSDSIRVVNAVLTNIDQIKRYPNVLILTTSNMTAAIDIAFVDRADIKQFVGLPSLYASYQIYYSCVLELMRKELIVPTEVILPVSVMQISNLEKNCTCANSKELMNICQMSQGFSGRTIRKVPVVAHALYTSTDTVSLQKFLDCLVRAVEYLKKEKDQFDKQAVC